LNDKDQLKDSKLIARLAGKFVNVSKSQIELMDVSPKQLTSLAGGHIPFLEHNDANRALMGANMQRQAVPLIKPEAPIVATGMEAVTGKYSAQNIHAKNAGKVIEISSERIVIENKDGKDIYLLKKFQRSNQGTSITN
jgi:DNA-directed RNA polymerase subunit beta